MSNEIIITRDDWDEYRTVQDSGMFNMYTPQARELTSLSKDKWLYILSNLICLLLSLLLF